MAKEENFRKINNPNIRMKTPETKYRKRRSKFIDTQKVVQRQFVNGFADFIRNHAVVSLAVGFVIATQVQVLVKQMVDSFITPTAQFFFKNALIKDSLTIHLKGRDVIYNWGIFANDFINFLFVLLAIYLIVKVFKLENLNKPKNQ
jgi:large-conductance mechanosensitive channel